MSKEKIDILNCCHNEMIKGMESIHTTNFPMAYTDTALNAMDVFAEQESIEFFKWVGKYYFEGMNGYVNRGSNSFSKGFTIEQLYNKFKKRTKNGL